MDNARYNTMDVKKCCESKLGIHFRSGNELNGWFELDGYKAARITVPKGKKPLPPKTYKSMARQLKLATNEFDELLKCPLTYEKYKKILFERSH